MRLWAITGLYIGGIIGAGFASGQELTVFFVQYGRAGLFGIVLATLFLFLGTVLVLEFSAVRNVSSYTEIFANLDPVLTTLLDLLYSLFLLIGISVMLAGTGAMGSTAMNSLFLRMATAGLVVWVLRKGVKGVLKTSGWLAPALVVILCGMALHHLAKHGVQLPEQGSWRALEAASLYGSYNVGFSMAVLASVHQHLKTKGQRWALALSGSVVLGLCMVLLFLALSTLSTEQLRDPFPLVHLVENWGSLAYATYQLMLWGAMYTTALAHALALVSRLTNWSGMTWSKASSLVIAATVGLSFFGFSTLVRIAYPILGLAGLWILANLLRERVC